MSRLTSITVSTGLIGAGAIVWAVAGRPLIANPDLELPLNPLGINHSPYGEVIAMAMQGPIDTYFTAGMSGGMHTHGPAKNPPTGAAPDQPTTSRGPRTPSLSDRLDSFVSSLNEAAETRTNRTPPSPALQRHLRRQAENKLRFAYQLDPANLANYTALDFFLKEPGVGTHPELASTARQLADDTINYCLKQDHDPRPALTAAAATQNVLEMMFNDARNDNSNYTTAQMRERLDQLDQCLARYDRISRKWDQSNQWELLSPQRIDECATNLKIICKLRSDAAQTIKFFEQKHLSRQVTN